MSDFLTAIDWNVVLAVVAAFIKAFVIVNVLLVIFAYMTLFERKVQGRMQVRYGPNRVGPFGLLQPLADGIKLFFKEDVKPIGADSVVYVIAPAVSTLVALVAFAVIPVGPNVNIFGREIGL